MFAWTSCECGLTRQTVAQQYKYFWFFFQDVLIDPQKYFPVSPILVFKFTFNRTHTWLVGGCKSWIYFLPDSEPVSPHLLPEKTWTVPEIEKKNSSAIDKQP